MTVTIGMKILLFLKIKIILFHPIYEGLRHKKTFLVNVNTRLC